jgi:hypothetical protein
VQPSAWRFPTPWTALAGALFLHKGYTVQSRGDRTHKVDWAQSAALLVRREAAEAIDFFDPAFFVYSDEVDFCKRLADAGWHTLHVPEARAVHHDPRRYWRHVTATLRPGRGEGLREAALDHNRGPRL